MSKFRVGVAGSLVLDILPMLAAGVDAEKLTSQGKLTECSGVMMYPGGEVGNTGLALRHLGADVVLISKVGNDVAGEILQRLMERENAECSIRVLSGMSSTVSIALALPGRDKSTLHSLGASQTFTSEDLEKPLLEHLDWFHFGYPTSMKSLYRNNGEELVRMLEKVKQYKIGISLDTSLPDLHSESGKTDWSGILPKLLPLVDIFTPSVEECLFMMDLDRYRKLAERHGSKDFTEVLTGDDVRELAEKAISYGAKAVLMKCGKRGLYLKTNRLSSGDTRWNTREIFCPPCVPENMVSTTGAGDTAIAGFLQALFLGRSPEQALKMAAFTAAQCIACPDTVSRIHNYAEMERLEKQSRHMENQGFLPGVTNAVQS